MVHKCISYQIYSNSYIEIPSKIIVEIEYFAMTQVDHEYYSKTSMKFKYSTQIQEMYTIYARITIALQVIKQNGEYHLQISYNDLLSSSYFIETRRLTYLALRL